MNLTPLLHAPFAIQLHVATVVPAFLIGTWLIFLSRKGTPLHRGFGYLYMTLMVVTAITSIFIHSLNPKGFLGLSPIHLFIPLTLFGIWGALAAARRRNIAGHRRAMLSVYVGALLIAGSFAFMPGRIMHAVVFGG